MADFNTDSGGADFNGPWKKKSIGQRETVQETGDLPFVATGLAVTDNQLFLRSRQHRKNGSKHTYRYWLIVIVINDHLF
jgi:hypothetical protein